MTRRIEPWFETKTKPQLPDKVKDTLEMAAILVPQKEPETKMTTSPKKPKKYRVLSADLKRRIVAQIVNGAEPKDLAKKYDVSYTAVNSWTKDHRYTSKPVTQVAVVVDKKKKKPKKALVSQKPTFDEEVDRLLLDIAKVVVQQRLMTLRRVNNDLNSELADDR